MRKIQTELIYNAAAKRKIKENIPAFEERKSANELFEFDSNVLRIGRSYAKAKSIDRGLANGKIQNINGALRYRQMYLGKTVNQMVRCCTADMNILQQEKITIDELVEKYYEHET